MAKSLLAHLYSHIRGSQEDIATLSLQYILSQSNELNRAFTRRIASTLSIQLDEVLQYICQKIGENRERPDMSGFSENGTEDILCEMKFYAGLTKNQPLVYIERLKNSGGKGLVFICPAVRSLSLWTKLKESCATKGYVEVDQYCIEIEGVRLAIITWAEVLELLTKVAASVAVEFLADIKQLEGFCSQMDSDAFIPFCAEDLSASVARKEERYYEVLDKTIELLCDDDRIKAHVGKMKASAYRRGYCRSIYINNLGLAIFYDRSLWKSEKSIETPFWMYFKDTNWVQTPEILSVYAQFPECRKDKMQWGLCLALDALEDATLIDVCEDIKRQILEYLEIFEKSLRSEK